MIKEQPDKKAVIEKIASMLDQLAKLYQIPNWDGGNAVLLAKWIITNYEYEPLEIVLDCLVNPPTTGQTNWRLTPDTIQSWLTVRLEEQVIKREKEYQKEKERLKLLENVVPERNWPDFDKLLEGTWYEEASKGKNKEQEYRKVREEYLNSKPKEKTPPAEVDITLGVKPVFHCVVGHCKHQCSRCLDEEEYIKTP